MRRCVEFFLYCFFRFAFWFRYRVEFKGLENIHPQRLSRKGGVLFLPNHPCVFVDPVLVTMGAWKKYPIRPMVVEYFYHAPIVHALMSYLNALPVPNFSTSSNSLKKKRSDQVFEKMAEGLKAGENFLIYPAGMTKSSSKEVLGGASGLHRVLSQVPEANIVLVRVKGLWGSRFSRYWTGSAPPMFPVIKWGIKQVLKNFIFFMPRRKVIVEYALAPEDFPRHASRLEINRYLENWYNLPDGLTPQEGSHPGDSLMLVPYTLGSKEVEPKEAESIERLSTEDKEAFALNNIPKEIQLKVKQKVGELAEMPVEKITPEMTLATDIGLDSLDTAELTAFLHDVYEIPGVPSSALTTVGKVMAIAAKQVKIEEESEDPLLNLKKWYAPVPREKAYIPPGDTLAEVFLNVAAKFPKKMCMADDRMGALDYNTVKLRAIILAQAVAKLPGETIGIMLPASVGAFLCIMACELAGKIPVMINWTVGPRHLETVKELSGIQATLSSWAFLDRLDGVDLKGLEEQMVLLEELRRTITWKDKLRALFLSKRANAVILKTLNPRKVQPDDTAVLLFTSGTESNPKGVPLSHRNILSNQRPVFEELELYTDDTLFGILPPFHSFGFTVSTLIPVFSGVRVAFYPNPTEGKKVADRFEKWKITVMCGAPTFLKGMLKAAEPGQLKTLRLCVTGAEKAPPELFKAIEAYNHAIILEGYGITECSPVLTLNRPHRPLKEVGQPLPNVSLKIVHPETYEPLPLHTQGLILAKGPNIFKGYLNPGLEPPFHEIDGEKWYKTGDLGSLDEAGYLTISGRQKRFIKVGPEMISLSAIEDALLKTGLKLHWPLSEETASLAILAREQAGERPKILLFVTFDLDVERANMALKEAGFSNLVKISQVVPVAEIPLMGTGKINYRALERWNT